jgi:hypothetical protein
MSQCFSGAFANYVRGRLRRTADRQRVVTSPPRLIDPYGCYPRTAAGIMSATRSTSSKRPRRHLRAAGGPRPGAGRRPDTRRPHPTSDVSEQRLGGGGGKERALVDELPREAWRDRGVGRPTSASSTGSRTPFRFGPRSLEEPGARRTRSPTWGRPKTQRCLAGELRRSRPANSAASSPPALAVAHRTAGVAALDGPRARSPLPRRPDSVHARRSPPTRASAR